jgi:hypothetical protein
VTSPVLACKPSVRFRGFTLPLLHLLGALLRVGRARGEVLTVTSGSDGTHSLKPYSRHYTGEALDFRTKHLKTSAEKHELIVQVQKELGPQFSVILEHEGRSNEHGHAQVKRGHVYSEDD